MLNGELYRVLSLSIRHQELRSEIHYQIKVFLKKNNVVRVNFAPVDVILSDEDTVVPDIVFVSNDRGQLIGENNIHGAPNWIVEIVSTNRKHDYVEKKELYERFGVHEYWIVDPIESIVQVYLLNQRNEFSSPLTYQFIDQIPVESISGLRIQL